VDEIFGVSTDRLLSVLLVLFAVGTLVLAASALRNRVAFKMALRNIPRRKSQTALIVFGLMLATLLFSASFTTGDTLTNSIRNEALGQIGRVDVVVKTDAPDSSDQFGPSPATRDDYFDESVAAEVRDRLDGDPEVAGVAPLAKETAPVTASGGDRSEPQVDVLGLDPESQSGFDRPLNASGEALPVNELGEGEVYVSAASAEGLDVETGDEVEVFLGPEPTELSVAGIYEQGANPASETSLAIGLERLQEITGTSGEVNNVLISHAGPATEGGGRTAETAEEIRPVLAANGLEADPVKRDALEEADENGAQFANIFLLFGMFSIAAGILLIFLIFVMLAAERKHELGVSRGVGMQRGHLVRMFAFEGALYSLMASAVGSVAGVGVGWAMVRIIGEALAGQDFRLAFDARPENILIAFTLGMVLTFAVVVVSAWRVSRLNIVRAIRDLPEPDRRGRTVKGVVFALLCPVLGGLAVWQGLQSQQLGAFMLGVSLIIIGAALLLRVLGVPDRLVFTAAGVGLLVFWLLPSEALPQGMSEGIELFFLSGIMLVVGAIWVVIYNADLLLVGIVALFGRLRGLPPVLKTAISYPMQNRFRTGMTLAMFSLVVFTLVTMSFINTAIAGVFDDTDRLSGGFDLQAEAGYTAPIRDMDAALEDAESVDAAEIAAVGELSGVPTEAKQRGADQEKKDLYVQGVDAGYSENVGYGFNITAEGYEEPREVWKALQEGSDTAVVSTALAPTRSDFSVGAPPPPIELSGFYQDDAALPDDLYITVENPETGEERDLRVIGVVEDSAFFVGSVMTSRETVDAIAGAPIPAQTYMFELEEGVDAAAVADALEEGFAQNGLQAEVIEELIREGATSNTILNNLLTGFMGLGLLVGIAALGVIAARSVVERRQQIGVLRALGFQRSQVRFAFLLESSFIALLGIAIGVALGGALSGQIIDGLQQGLAGVTYRVPWAALTVIVVAAYVASLLTTYLPARQASKVYPAEALRYE
jgi:putative ABC transport system permease protein